MNPLVEMAANGGTSGDTCAIVGRALDRDGYYGGTGNTFELVNFGVEYFNVSSESLTCNGGTGCGRLIVTETEVNFRVHAAAPLMLVEFGLLLLLVRAHRKQPIKAE